MTSDLEIDIDRSNGALTDHIAVRLHYSDHMGYYELTDQQAWELGKEILEVIEE